MGVCVCGCILERAGEIRLSCVISVWIQVFLNKIKQGCYNTTEKNNNKGRKQLNYTYILECKDGTYYTGWTNNLEKRIKDHNEGKGAKYTKARLPVSLIYHEEFQTKEEAMRREYAIKHMTRTEKTKLISGYRERITEKD